jgi:hypothetical protein
MWRFRRFGLGLVILLCLATVGCGKTTARGSGETPRRHAAGSRAADPSQPSDRAPQREAAQHSNGTPSGSAGQRSSGAPGALGAPGDRSKDARAAGAPIRIPSIVHDQGRPLADVRSEIESGIKRQCGGDLCVTLRGAARDGSGYDSCTFWKTEPPQESTVRRGTTVVIVSGTGPCPAEPTIESPPTSEPDGTAPSSSAPDETQPPPTT